MKDFFENNEVVYFIQYPDTILKGFFSEYWDFDSVYIKYEGKTILTESCKIFKSAENAKAYLREQKIHRKVFVQEEIKRLTKELESL